MARCRRSDSGSVVLDSHGGGGSFRSWSAFSGSAFRRMILDSMRCGASRHRREGIDVDSDYVESVERKPEISESKTKTKKRNGGSEKLSDLLSHSEPSEPGLEETESESETKRKVEALEEFQGVVRRLQCSGLESESKRIDAALAVRKLAKEDSEARETLAMLGAIPPLVGMLDEEDDPDLQIASLYALLNLGIGNDKNKAAIVKAGAVHKMVKLIQCTNTSVSEAVVANFLGLSALDANKPIIGSSGAVSFLVKILQNADKSSCQAKQDALRAIYNLSISSSNVPHLLETDLVPFLMSTLGDMEVSDRILAILSNVVSTREGRKAVSSSVDAFNILVDVLNWTDSPSCQEKVSYILMVMAHKAFGDRQSMIEAGVVSSLLELTLLGSTLAQKRASRILECLRVDKGKQISENYSVSLGTAVSAPICGSSSSSVGGASRNLKLDEVDEEMMSEESKAVKQLVQQSLQNNMRRIVKRANLPQDFVPSEHFKSLTATSTSKSLPF